MEEQAAGDIPNGYIITLYDDAKFDAHIHALEAVIDAENSRTSSGAVADSAPQLFSQIGYTGNDLHLYSGIFSQAVLRWIRTREEVKGVEQDVNAGKY